VSSIRTLVLALATLPLALSLHAQAAAKTKVDPAIRKGVVTLNPFAIFAEYVAGDLEVKASPSWTLGAGASWAGISDFNSYRSIEAKARYYPGEKALEGFSVAATAGFASANDRNFDFNGQRTVNRRTTRPTIGTELSYQWIIGPSSRFVAVTGLGLKRFLGNEGNSDPINVPILPTARINIGFAF